MADMDPSDLHLAFESAADEIVAAHRIYVPNQIATALVIGLLAGAAATAVELLLPRILA